MTKLSMVIKVLAAIAIAVSASYLCYQVPEQQTPVFALARIVGLMGLFSISLGLVVGAIFSSYSK
jgi:hypothetical protein